jgi:anhydro-N-acetylmuramic acid kinase
MRVAGIMSGTALDGIDVAIADMEGRGYAKKISVIAARATPYPVNVREALLAVSNTLTHTATISRLNALLGELYAEAFLTTCRKRRVDPKSVHLIGCHGQTIYHEGQPCEYLGRRFSNTLQIGEGAVIAERTGIPTISNFRERDIAAGGKGAPLVPYADYVLFRDSSVGRIALNIGGIANITAIPKKATPGQVVAFDTGPGNMIIDALVKKYTNGESVYDRGGRMAASGEVHSSLLEAMMADQYFSLSPPKTAGREQYGADFVSGLIATGIELPALIATATEFTARSIALAVQELKGNYAELIVSGGGCHNLTLMRRLRALLPDLSVLTSKQRGIDPDSKEALAFAILAYQSRLGLQGNLPSATGARHAVVLGKLSM